ncbi:pyridoxine biosynthesis protein [Orbilia ellipsospora]|uniref:Pyridoxine biosynthesis protein n=1 Tax=Orbilia ellipsospora TaxID=2528407 RepID=A0AAV9X724_9PEZI
MASTMSSALRTSKRLLHPGYTWRAVATRGISSTRRDCKAHNFNMPALSPTMTEGTIASWKINEGDKFSAGDVILEVETDKAQMDVEAQDDGILAKIFVQAGKDQVQVGTRIGILADVDDDISSLEIPPEDNPVKQESSSPEPEKETKPAASESKPSKPQSSEKSDDAAPSHGHKPRKNPFVASPGLTHLLHMNGLEMSDIQGTGPGGRVLKGDVLAHLGKIDKEKPKSIAGEIAKLAKLDLSNIVPKKIEPKKEAKQEVKKEKKIDPMEEVEVSVPISLARVSDGHRPVSDFIARAVEYANSGLPSSKIPPSTSQLFDEILGLPSVKAEPKYAVKVSGYKPAPAAPVVSDLFDEIIGVTKPKSSSAVKESTLKEFKVKVPAVDRDRAEFFLAKVKFSLEQDERADR